MKLFRAVSFCVVSAAAATSVHSQSPRTIVYAYNPAGEAAQVLNPKPRIDLGESGAAAELFDRIRVVRQQANGRIIVGNRNTPELRVFDANGRYVKTIGRKGQGPGEFQDIDDVVVRRGDSMVVLDRAQRRFTFFDPDGGVVSTLRLQPPFETSPYNVTVSGLDDGTLLIGYGLVTTRTPSPQAVSVPSSVGMRSTDRELTPLDLFSPVRTSCRPHHRPWEALHSGTARSAEKGRSYRTVIHSLLEMRQRWM